MTESLDPDSSVNPYAAPKADLDVPAPQPAQGGGSFYAMSPTKLIIMSMLTMGIYDLCFWWRQWRARERAGDNISVFWRTFFAGFTSFDFKKTLTLALNLRDLAMPPLLAMAPAVYLISLFGGRVLESAMKAPSMQVVGLVGEACLVLVRASMLAVIQRAANDVLRADGYRGPYNRGVSARTLAVAAAGLLLWGLSALGALTPPEPSTL